MVVEVDGMSLKNVARLFYKMDHDPVVKNKVDAIVAKYNSPEFSTVSREYIIETELVPLGQTINLEYTVDEFMEYLGNPSLQKVYETARVVGGLPTDPDFGRRIAAKVARDSIINDVIGVADKYYQDTYSNDVEFGDID